MLEKIVGKFKNARILVIGDVMLDRYVIGDAYRLSPEAPVPVVKMTDERYLLGGAANVAANVAALGGKAYLCGVVGQDSDGLRFRRIAEDLGIEAHLYKSPKVPTIVKTRVLANRHQLVRVDKEERVEFNEGLSMRFFKRIKPLVESVDLVILSDYDKGVLADRNFCECIIEDVRFGKGKPVLVDPKPVNMKNFCYANCIAPNLKEAEEMVAKLVPYVKLDPGEDYLKGLSREIISAFRSESVAITCGSEGIFACYTWCDNAGQQGLQHVSLPAKAKEVYDVSGAGDTALAVIGLAWASGAGLFESCEIANAACGVVVGKVGTATLTQKELRANLKK